MSNQLHKDESKVKEIIAKSNNLAIRLGWNEIRHTDAWMECGCDVRYIERLISDPAENQCLHVAGVFPVDVDGVAHYMETYKHILMYLSGERFRGSVSYAKTLTCKFLEDILFLHNDQFYASVYNPFNHINSFQRHFKGKRLCVVTPFPKTFESQLGNLHKLFPDGRLTALDPSDVSFIKAPSHKAISNNVENPYTSWQEAITDLCQKIDSKSYDILLTGCGSLSLPLTFHAFTKGKTAMNLGGDLQLLFGVKGNRWVQDNYKFNEHWVYPLPEETPKSTAAIEMGAYWK